MGTWSGNPMDMEKCDTWNEPYFHGSMGTHPTNSNLILGRMEVSTRTRDTITYMMSQTQFGLCPQDGRTYGLEQMYST